MALPAVATLRVTLSWRAPEEVPAGPLLSPRPGRRITEEPDEGRVEVSGTLAAPTTADLAAELNRLSTELSSLATVTEAVLEMSLLRRSESPENERLLLAAESLLREIAPEVELQRTLTDDALTDGSLTDDASDGPAARVVVGVEGLAPGSLSALRDRLGDLS